MNPTILVLGRSSAGLRSISTLLSALPVHLNTCETLQEAKMQNLPGPVDLVLFEYRPRPTLKGSLADLAAAFPDLPLIAVGPDYTGEVRRALGQYPGIHYLPLNAPAPEKLDLIRSQLGLGDGQALTVGPLTLHLKDGTALFRRLPLNLTATEFQLMHVLMQHPGRPFEAATLGALIHSRAVALHVHNVRRKLSTYAAHGLLKGDAQSGYLIDARITLRHSPNPVTSLRHHLLRL